MIKSGIEKASIETYNGAVSFSLSIAVEAFLLNDRKLGSLIPKSSCSSPMEENTSRNISIISILEEESPPDYDNNTSPPPFHTNYDDLPQSLLALQLGPPTDIVNVPMISSHYKPSLKNMFTGRKEVVINVHVRRMSREHYVKHYAHDGLGNYIGTGAPALDAALVIIPGRSTKEDFVEQIRRLRVGREGQLLRAVGTRNPPIGSYYG